MTLAPGQVLSLTIDKPAAGGRMIARVNGQVVLVSGTLPGERIRARIERVGKGVAFADPVSVEEPSADRRTPFADPQCGGCLYSHIAYPRQLDLKADIIADAFGRIGRIVLNGPVRVAPSPEDGYRMRARLHVRDGQIGFFREGSHDLCEARPTRQLLTTTSDALDRLAAGLQGQGIQAVRELEVSENVDASARAVHLEAATPIDPTSFAALIGIEGITGLSLGVLGQAGLTSGSPLVSDVIAVDGYQLTLRRHVLSFFQGNRYLLAALVMGVIGAVRRGASVLDLYAGAGLFAVAAAVVREARVTAVEGDRLAAADLDANAQPCGGAVEPVHQSVESFTAKSRSRPDTLIVDPPRTGLSREAIDGVVRAGAATVIYVSCDVATLARDARKLIEAGYAIERVEAFDLFPNTPHVETVVMMQRT